MANTSFRIASLNRVYHYISLAAFVLFELFFLCVRSHSIMQSSSIVRACAIWLFRTENYCTHVQRCTISTRSLSLSGAIFFISNFTIFRYFLLSCHGIENVRQSGWKRKDWEREMWYVKYHMIFYESACTEHFSCFSLSLSRSIHLSLSLWVAGAQYVFVSVCVLLNMYIRVGQFSSRKRAYFRIFGLF